MNYTFTPYPGSAKVHAAKPLPQTREHAAVVIVGGGPVGLAIAVGLAKHGVRSTLIEADDGVCSGSRAICISRRSLEIIERLGALPAFLDKGLPWTGGRSFYRADEVLHFLMPQDDNQKLPPMINLAQFHIEQFLLDAAEAHADLIDIRWQTRVTSIATRADGATLTLATPDGEYQLDTDWLVAADGGRSVVRESLGLKLVGTSYEGRYVIVDIALDSARPAERLAYFDPPSNPGSTVLVHKQPDNVWRIDYQLREDEDPEQAVLPCNVIPRVQSLLKMMGERSDWSPIWITIYKANALTLEKYRHGRVLFAGDAAHLVPIFGVRGANSGIDDADNLAWKLAFVVRKLAAPRLLDSYSDERVFAAHENLRHGTKSTEFMAPPSFAFELMRTAVLSLAVKHPCVRPLINPRQSSAIAYTDSPLNWVGNSVDDAPFLAGPPAGTVLPECPVGIVEGGQHRAGHMTDLLGPCFTLLLFGDAGADERLAQDLERLERTMLARTLPLRVLRLTREPAPQAAGLSAWDHRNKLFALYGAQAGSAYLVRPDGHVLARWRAIVVAEAEAAIEFALGQPFASAPTAAATAVLIKKEAA